MKLLVTGSEGALMQAVIPRLLEQGHNVLGVDNFARYGELERARDYDFRRGDLADPAFVDDLVRGTDGVLQAAGLIYGVGGFHRRRADILSNDVKLHTNILEAMCRHSVRHIAYMSSSMVYERAEPCPSREEDAFAASIPATDYGLSKLVGERLVIAFAAQYDLQYTIWRPFNIITPHERGEAELGTSHVFADYLRNLVLERKNPLPIIGDGEQIRCFTWIEDVARGVAEHAFESPPAANETFNLGNPEPITMRALAELIYRTAQDCGRLPKDAPALAFETALDYADDVKKRIPNVDKARERLGWTPTQRIADSIKICLDNLEAHPSAAA